MPPLDSASKSAARLRRPTPPPDSSRRDAQLRRWTEALPPGARKEYDGPLERIVGLGRGYLLAPRELGLAGRELDQLIARQRDFFAARGEPVEWKTHSHDLPDELPEHLRAAGFAPEPPETVVTAEAERVAEAAPALPPEVTLRPLAGLPDLRRLTAMQGKAFGAERTWRAAELVQQIEAAPELTVVLAAEAGGEVVSGARSRRPPRSSGAPERATAPGAGRRPRAKTCCAAVVTHRSLGKCPRPPPW